MVERELCLVTGNANKELAQKIAKHINLELGKLEVSTFSDGEIRIEIDEHESMRGKDVFIIQPVCHPVNDNLMELLIMTDALKRASARAIAAVIPYYGYARQDKKVKPREPITAKLIANLLETSGVDRVLAMDLHAASIQGFFNIPVDHLSSTPTVVNYFKQHGIGGKKTVIVSPDVGGVVRARDIANRLNSQLAIISKRRPKPNKTEVYKIIGFVKGYRCVMIDDMVDTAGTLVEGAKALVEKGAKEITAFCTHPVLSGSAIQKIEDSFLKEVLVTDTIPIPAEKRNKKIKVISVANVFAEAILRGFEQRSISELFH
ncbi:MAG: ribose-phosphate pyrophosphokinase [bacterium]